MLWLNFNLTNTAIPSGGKTLVLTLNVGGLALRPFTIVRTRVHVKYSSDQLSASETPQANLGAIVVSDQAVAGGQASIPGPTTNPDAPFYVYEGMIDEFLLATAVGFNGNEGYTFDIDSKAMRKVGNNEDIAVIVEQGATLGANLAMNGRFLIKLH